MPSGPAALFRSRCAGSAERPRRGVWGLPRGERIRHPKRIYSSKVARRLQCRRCRGKLGRCSGMPARRRRQASAAESYEQKERIAPPSASRRRRLLEPAAIPGLSRADGPRTVRVGRESISRAAIPRRLQGDRRPPGRRCLAPAAAATRLLSSFNNSSALGSSLTARCTSGSNS